MEFGRRWKIRTSFGWVLLSVRAPGDPEPKRDAAARDREQQARFHLRYELRAASDTPSQPLREVQRFFSGDDRGFGAHDRAPAETELTSLDAMIENELVARRIELDFEPFWTESLTEREFEGEAPPLKPLPPPEPETSFIAVNLLDQDGKPVIGRRWTIELPDGSKHSGVTDFEGWARVKGFTKDGTAKISFPQFDELDHQTRASAERVIEPIEGEEEAEEELETDEEEQEEVEEEESADSEQTPESLPLAELAGAAELVEQAAKSETAEIGKIFMELWDSVGEERHANRAYSIEGPVSLSGTTDASGRIEHSDLPAGDYILRLSLDDSDAVTPALIQANAISAPHVRLLGPNKNAVVARLIGMFFDTSKSFLLPIAIPAVRDVRRLYDQHPGSELLVVGHTDTAGKPSYNDPLSLERADAISAFLRDRVEEWIVWYGTDKPQEKRWGDKEDTDMISALKDADTRPSSEAPMAWFRRTRNMASAPLRDVRLALIREYMSADGTSLPADIELTTHGCGENFPAVTTGDEVDLQDNRRVELFFFDDGIKPPPPSKNSKPGSKEYPKWLGSVSETFDLRVGAARTKNLIISIYVGERFPDRSGAVVVSTASGTEVARFLVKDLPFGAPGHVFVNLDTSTLPDPVALRRVTDFEDIILLGPCSLKQLCAALDDEDFETAGKIGYPQAVNA